MNDMKMVVCDLSAIEHRVVGWIARCPGIMKVHLMRRDPYLDFAVKLYHARNLNYEQLVAEYEAGAKEFRQNSKPPVLGCGFGLGGGELKINEYGDEVRTGLWGYALNVCNVDMPKELAHEAVKIYRREYPEVPQLWMDMEQAFKWVLKEGGEITVGKDTWNKRGQQWENVKINEEQAFITFSCVHSRSLGQIVRMKLPSGRFLHYLNCRIEMETYIYTDKKTGKKKEAEGEVIYYEGVEHSATENESGAMARKSHKWGQTKTYGGKLTENGVQAVARDVLVHCAHLAKGMGFKIWGLFHDEIATLVKQTWDAPTLEDLRWCMSQPPKWGPTMLLDAAGYEGTYYHKG